MRKIKKTEVTIRIVAKKKVVPEKQVNKVEDVKEKEDKKDVVKREVKVNEEKLKLNLTTKGIFKNESTLFDSPVREKSRDSPINSPCDSFHFVFHSKDITIAKNYLILVMKYFNVSKINRDICAKGLEISLRSKMVFDEIAKEILKRRMTISLPPISDDPNSNATVTTTTTTDVTNTTEETTTTETVTTTATVTNVDEDEDSKRQSAITTNFEAFIERHDTFNKFSDCLWNIYTFLGYSINEEYEVNFEKKNFFFFAIPRGFIFYVNASF